MEKIRGERAMKKGFVVAVAVVVVVGNCWCHDCGCCLLVSGAVFGDGWSVLVLCWELLSSELIR